METKNRQSAFLTSLPLPSRIFTTILVTDRGGNILWSNLALGALAIVALLVHSYNMFGYPLYYGDEGIYMEQAYAVLKLGRLAFYTYFYDHAPTGWLQIAVWSALTGGFHKFGTAIDGGRVLMLLFHVATVMVLFRIALQLTANTFIATITGILFTLSPLSVHFGRLVMLDNMMGFWLMLAIALLLNYKGNILRLLSSGFCFGVAVLTKENAVVLLPGFIYAIWALVKRDHARFARAAWLFAALATISTYFLFAVLKNELIPSSEHVSLIGSVLWQSSRKGGPAWEQSSEFYRTVTGEWLTRDFWLIGLGITGTLWNIFQQDPKKRFVGLVSFLVILSIARGGPVYPFYIPPMLPLLALNFSLSINNIATWIRVPALLPMVFVIVATVSCVNLQRQEFMFTFDATKMQRQAIAWVQEHVPPDALILIDDDLWVDLHDGGPGKPSFPNAHSHWKAARDPAIYQTLLQDNWRNIDYLVVVNLMDQLIFAKERDKLPYKAYINSTSVVQFKVDTGWGIETLDIRRVNDLSAM